MVHRPIPSSNEPIPIIGLGTWIQFDVGDTENERQPLRNVLTQMLKEGGKLIDSSPMYHRSEKVIGELTNELDLADKFFYATKVWTTGRQKGIEQMNRSLSLMQRKTMDLMQVHNLVDWKTHLETMREWKEQGKIRYTGVTHYAVSAHEQLEQIIRTEKIDFVQFNYSIRTRNAEKRLLHAAQDRGVAVIVNEPFETGSLFQLTKGKPLPEWASEYNISTWSQFFLKYILAHPAVTCVIPGTSNPKNLTDNMQAASHPLPDEPTRKKMISYLENL